MPASVGSSASGGSGASSFVDSVADLPGAGKNPADDRDQEDSAWERSHGLCDDIFGAVYLAQTPHEQALSVKKGVASSLIQSVQLLFLLLNPYAGLFAPDTGLWVYKYFSWVLVKIPLMEVEMYSAYVAMVYVALGLLLVVVGLIGWMATAIKNDEQERRKYRKVLNLVRPAAGLLFLVFPVAIMDMLSGVFMCDWRHLDQPVSLLWPAAGSCFEGQHMIHAAVAAVTFVLYAVVSVLMGVGTCEQNPASVHMSSSPNLDVRCKITVLKVLLVLAASQLTSQHKWQSVACMLISGWAFWMNFRQVPYYRKQTTSLHCGLWLGMTYLSVLGLVGALLVEQGQPEEEVKLQMTWWAGVLIMPVGIAGIIASRLRQRLLDKELARIAAAPVGAKLHKILPLQGRWHVELLARCVREGRDLDKGSVAQESLDLAETVLAYGAAKYGREDPFMLTLQASFSIFVHRDTAMARMQLQQINRDKTNLLLAYAQFCCGEYMKASKDTASEGGMLDLASFVEFARNYRSAVRSHRTALLLQREFWRVLLKERVKYADLEDCLTAMCKAEVKAAAVYRRVLERYPSNAKLLKAYARFVEEVQHDPWRANRYYSEAERQGSSDGSMNLSSMIKAMEATNAKATPLEVDELKDGICIINSAGIMMTTNTLFCQLFGYTRAELEGHNVSMIVPPPFGTRHNSYMERYLATGQPHIMGVRRRIIGLHKDRYMVPAMLFAAHLSGSGADSVFVALLRPHLPDPGSVEVWCAPNTGAVMVTDSRVGDFLGYSVQEVSGQPIGKFVSSPEFEKSLAAASHAACNIKRESVAAAPGAKGSSSEGVTIRVKIAHKYMDAQEMEATLEPSGTLAMPWVVVRLSLSTPPLPYAVLDNRLSISSVSSGFASMLGYQPKQLQGMNLSDIIPAPWSQLHSHWVKELPPKAPQHSCRSGLTVPLLTKGNAQLQVQLKVSSKDDGEGMKHVMQISRTIKHGSGNNQQRLLISVDRTSGCIVDVAEDCQPVFGFDPRLLIGQQLSAVLDAFEMWEGKHGSGSATLLLQNLTNSASARIGESWRVGVKHMKQPGADQQQQQQLQDASKGWDKVLSRIRGSSRKGNIAPARLQVVQDTDEGEAWASDTRVSLALWRADCMSGVLEVDEALRILRADEASGIILGHGSSSIVRHSLHRYLSGLPLGSDLLQSGPKGGIKRKGPAWVVGQPKTFAGTHRDGLPLQVTLQAVGKEGAASRRLMLHISANKPYTGSLEAFQNISEAHCAATDDDGAGSDASGKTAATAAPTRVQRSSATGAWGVRMQEPVKATAAVSRTGPAAAAGRKVGAHFAADYDGAMTDDMAADLAADIGDGNASQHSGSDEQQQQQRQPARGSGRGVHASPRFVPGGGNTASRAAARIGSGPGATFAQWEGAGRSSRVPPRQPANVRLAAAADEDEDGSWQGSEAGRAAEDGCSARLVLLS